MVNCAEQSPRICADGTIRWYEGDTFDLEFDLTFSDESGIEIPVESTDVISIYFRDRFRNIVHEASVVGNTILIINIDEEATKNFKLGEYTYCVKRNAQYITTVMRNNRVVIE